MKPPSRRLAALFCLCLLGILVVLGLVVAALAGAAGVAVYVAVALLVVSLAIARGRRLWAPPPLPPGRTCTCCTTSQHDPVEVV